MLPPATRFFILTAHLSLFSTFQRVEKEKIHASLDVPLLNYSKTHSVHQQLERK